MLTRYMGHTDPNSLHFPSKPNKKCNSYCSAANNRIKSPQISDKLKQIRNPYRQYSYTERMNL